MEENRKSVTPGVSGQKRRHHKPFHSGGKPHGQSHGQAHSHGGNGSPQGAHGGNGGNRAPGMPSRVKRKMQRRQPPRRFGTGRGAPHAHGPHREQSGGSSEPKVQTVPIPP